jgi:hypothetical protein
LILSAVRGKNAISEPNIEEEQISQCKIIQDKKKHLVSFECFSELNSQGIKDCCDPVYCIKGVHTLLSSSSDCRCRRAKVMKIKYYIFYH